jgi:hypothetical protein
MPVAGMLLLTLLMKVSVHILRFRYLIDLDGISASTRL